MIHIDQINIKVGTIVFILKYNKAFERVILIFQVYIRLNNFKIGSLSRK